MASLSKTCPDSVPYERAIRNQRILLSSTESQEGLAQQLATTSEKISQLEQDREHWKLEAQLVQIKLTKEAQKCVVIKEELRRLRTGGKVVSPVDQDSLVAQAMAKASEVDSISGQRSGMRRAQPQIDRSILGQLEGITMDFGESDETSRENLIKSHYTTRLAQLTAQRQVVDGKVVNFSSECRALQKRLALAEKAKEKHMEELQAAHKNVTQLQDELQTTTRNYENQLSMMSEHLCSMNEKLTSQKDQIDALKLSAKPNKKGKSK